jgi:cation:H+ antiporter
MPIWLAILFFVVGTILLVKAADWLVEHAAMLAEGLGVPHMVVGLTIVAFGTSAPELAAGIGSSLRTTDADPMVNQLALGAVIGSNIANIALILAIGAMLFPIVSQRSVRTKELPLMLLVMAVGCATLLGGSIGRVEGGLLLAGVFLYTYDAYAAARRGKQVAMVEPHHEEQIERELSKQHTPRWWVRHAVMVVVGVIGLAGGAELLVRGSVEIAEVLGVPQMVIGLTMVAVGTSLPELATSISAARKKHTEILLGNVIGSNVFNTLCVLGASALIRPIVVGRGTLAVDAPVMMGVGVAAWLMALTRKHIGRVEGALLLAAYAGYVSWVVLNAR